MVNDILNTCDKNSEPVAFLQCYLRTCTYSIPLWGAIVMIHYLFSSSFGIDQHNSNSHNQEYQVS